MHYHNNGPQNGRTLSLTWIHYTVRMRSDVIVLSSDFVFFPLYLIVGASHVSLTCIQLVPCLFLILSLSLLFIRLPAQPVFTPASSYLLPLFSCSCVQFLVCFWACSWLFGFTASQTEINLLFIHPAYVSSVLILIPVFFCACVCSQMLTSIIKDIN